MALHVIEPHRKSQLGRNQAADRRRQIKLCECRPALPVGFLRGRSALPEPPRRRRKYSLAPPLRSTRTGLPSVLPLVARHRPGCVVVPPSARLAASVNKLLRPRKAASSAVL